MFIHAVLFKVRPNEVRQYRKDNKMWAGYAKKTAGFVDYFTMKRLGFQHQYASVYEWKTKVHHERFMKKYHDWLVSQSRAHVKVLEYYDLREIDNFRQSS